MSFVVKHIAASGGGGGLRHRDRNVAAYNGAIVSSEAQDGCYAHHAQQKENGAPRPTGIAAVVYNCDGLLGGGRGKRWDMMEIMGLAACPSNQHDQQLVLWLGAGEVNGSTACLAWPLNVPQATATKGGSHSPHPPFHCSTRCWPGSIFVLPLPTRRGRRT